MRTNLRPNIWFLCKDEHVANSSVIFMSNQVIVVHIHVNGRSWHLGIVHACTAYISRRDLWNDILSLHLGDLCLMGDFIVVLGSHERSCGVARQTRPSEEFLEFIDDAQLLDVESSGSQFNWSTRQSSLVFMVARLDWVLASQSFLDLWHYLEVTVLTRYSLDHHPLLVMAKETLGSTSPRPFRFLSRLTLHESF
ncbi:hypothetical protein ACS0TY_035061 [Phlomoides rotata]